MPGIREREAGFREAVKGGGEGHGIWKLAACVENPNSTSTSCETKCTPGIQESLHSVLLLKWPKLHLASHLHSLSSVASPEK